jgi:fumarylpyruvate hydrolase
LEMTLSEPRLIDLPILASDSYFPVRRIYCVGRNYVEHIREMKEADERDPPFFFQKPTDAIVLDGGIVPYPPLTKNLHHEIELVVAMGSGGYNIGVAKALDYVFGYAIGLDMTRRDLQRDAKDRGLPWEVGKSFDHSAPCSAIHKVSDVGHVREGAIALAVNGVIRQKGDLREMIWKVPEIISNLSGLFEIKPGDLIFTGTPSGVGPVLPGDRLDGTVDRLGSLRITIGPQEG